MRRGLLAHVVTLLAVVIAAVLSLPSRAPAINVNAVWPELNLPGFRLTPFFTERVEYQSNVLLQPRNELDDVISRSIPGIVVELPFGPHRFDLTARAEIVRYFQHSQFDTEHVFVVGRLAFNFPGGLSLRLREELARTSDPPGTELTGRITSTTNTVSPEVEYALGGIARRFSIGAAYTYTHVAFDDTVTELNREEHTGALTLFWRLTGKSDLLGSVAYGVKTFDNASSRDTERVLGMIGLRGELTSRLSSTFRIGYEHRSSSLHTIDAVIASGDWVFVPTERTRLSFVTQRSIEESVFASNTTYTTTVATLLAQHRFGPKITGSARVFGGMNEYPNKDLDVTRVHRRTDHFVGLGLGVEYQIQRWLAVGADYSVVDRSSNFSGFDYTDHVVGVKITLSI